MPFFGQNFRSGMFPPNGQQFGPPPQMGRQQIGMPRPNEFARPREAFYPPYPVNPRQGQQQFNLYPQQQQQQQGSRFSGLSDNLNTVMGHVGTITNGINTMRQVGAMLNLFK
ncbi:hypothetical protein MKX73_09540 [Solibacillus sp. FSL W7-1436]|uniref:hypothetical protein n=1 Tax=Solibacillus sp. FSL W7-1436 TaxID=2921705 RepID=UPI0030FA9E69